MHFPLPLFSAHFERAVNERAMINALAAGVRGAQVEGCACGVSALIYLAEAVLIFRKVCLKWKYCGESLRRMNLGTDTFRMARHLVIGM